MRTCTVCQKPKAALECGICTEPVCKSCAQFVDGAEVSFYSPLPKILQFGTYCSPCFDAQVAPELARYAELMESARNVDVYMRNQSKETRLMKRSPKPFKVEECPDREEAMLRLAFLAVSAGYNALVDVDITAQKVRNAGYQTSVWTGTAFGAQIDSGKPPPPSIGSPN